MHVGLCTLLPCSIVASALAKDSCGWRAKTHRLRLVATCHRLLANPIASDWVALALCNGMSPIIKPGSLQGQVLRKVAGRLNDACGGRRDPAGGG